MKFKKLNTVIKRLREYFGGSYDYKSNPSSVLDVLIATKLSQNTTDKSSFAAYTNLKNKFNNWGNVADADIKEIRECIKVCGLSNIKAKNIKFMLQSMRKKYGSMDLSFMNEFDNEKVYEELLQYDGIGVKTISCVLIFAMGKDAFPVDTHVNRILNRMGIVKTKSAEKTFEQIRGRIPEGKSYELHANLIKFGRNICKAKNPLCSICFLYSLCEFSEKKLYRRKKIVKKLSQNNFIILENI